MRSVLLDELWRSIGESGSLPVAILRFGRTGVETGLGQVLVGLDPKGQRHLCIPAPVKELGLQDSKSAGVTVNVRNLVDENGKEIPVVDVHCNRPDLDGLFALVATEILECVQARPGSPFARVHEVLGRWRALLEPADTDLLGPEQLAALLAELLFLDRLGSGAPPVRFWTGPEKAPHDFVCGGVDFEVKSSLATAGRMIKVNGIHQLTASPGTRLHLWFVRLRKSPGRGVSVPSVIDALVGRGVDSAELLGKLKSCGYSHIDADTYRSQTFEEIESFLYSVDENFPRITASSFVAGLPPQISRIEYSVNLDAQTPRPHTLEESTAILSRIMDCK